MNESNLQVHALGHSLRLDTVSRSLLTAGARQRRINACCPTGLSPQPTVFEQALLDGAYSDSIRLLQSMGLIGNDLSFALALEDLTRAVDGAEPATTAGDGSDRRASMDASPRPPDEAPNGRRSLPRPQPCGTKADLFIEIPATPDGLSMAEEVIVDGVPVNFTGLFTREHYLAAAGAYLRGLERRLAADLDLKVASVASLFVSRRDASDPVATRAPRPNGPGIAAAMRAYRAHRELLQSARWVRLSAAGARPQRLLWAGTRCVDMATSAIP